MVQLAFKLLGSADASVAMSVQGMVAGWALDLGDEVMAIKVCRELVSSTIVQSPLSPNTANDVYMEDAWRVCFRLVTESRGSLDPLLRKNLVGFALQWCDPQSLGEVLDAARTADLAAQMSDSFGDDRLYQGFGLMEIERDIKAQISETATMDGVVSIDEQSGITRGGVFESVTLKIKSAGRDVWHTTALKSGRRILSECALRLEMLRRGRKGIQRRDLITEKSSLAVGDLQMRDSMLIDLALEILWEGDSGLALVYLLDVNDVRNNNKKFLNCHLYCVI